MWACTASVLTARLGCINTQLLGNIVPRWVAEEAGICRSVAAGVEMKSQHADSRPHLMRFLLGSSVLVQCRARVSQSFHGCHRGHQWNTAFKSIKSERSANTLYSSCAKLSVMHRLPPTENGLNCCKTVIRFQYYIKLQCREIVVWTDVIKSVIKKKCRSSLGL